LFSLITEEKPVIHSAYVHVIYLIKNTVRTDLGTASGPHLVHGRLTWCWSVLVDWHRSRITVLYLVCVAFYAAFCFISTSRRSQ